MKIDRIYISCCKKDFYFTRICVASVRYWNAGIPISLLKDRSKGDFDTSELEAAFNVSIEPLPFVHLDAYCKLYPFFQEKDERIFLIDSDVVWLGDLVSELERFDEDLIVEADRFDNYREVAGRWYFNWPELVKHYPDYRYPGFLFNTGQFVLNTARFSAGDFQNVIQWQENMRPEKPDVFLCEDQGVINYVVAKKMAHNEITVRPHHFFIWGWSNELKKISIEDVMQKKAVPLLVHWYGKKNGLISYLPGKDLLAFFESFYYQHIPGGKRKMKIDRLGRTIKNFGAFSYEVAKRMYYGIRGRKP